MRCVGEQLRGDGSERQTGLRGSIVDSESFMRLDSSSHYFVDDPFVERGKFSSLQTDAFGS